MLSTKLQTDKMRDETVDIVERLSAKDTVKRW